MRNTHYMPCVKTNNRCFCGFYLLRPISRSLNRSTLPGVEKLVIWASIFLFA